MRATLSLVPAVLTFAASGLAASVCTTGTLASYIALGSSGCTVGTNTFSDFQILKGSAFASAIPAAEVGLTPLGASNDPGLIVGISAQAAAGTVLELIFTYRVTGNLYTGSSNMLTDSSEAGDGAVSNIQNYCLDGAFGPDGVSGCTGRNGNLLTLDSVQNTDSRTFGPGTPLSITDDFTIDGGLAGSASAGSITDRFSAIPEPFNLLLAFIGLLFVAIVRLWLVSSSSFRR